MGVLVTMAGPVVEGVLLRTASQKIVRIRLTSLVYRL